MNFDEPGNRTEKVLRWVGSQRTRYPSASAKEVPPGYVAAPGATFDVTFAAGPEFHEGLSQFEAFLKVFDRGTGSSPSRSWQFSTDPGLAQGFRAEISEVGVRIVAATDRGFVDALHYLEREMADAGGLWLKPGVNLRQPSLGTFFSEGIFVPGHQTAENPGDLSPEYLGLLRHFGANALKLNIRLTDFWSSETLPLLNAPGRYGKVEQVRSHAGYLCDHGLDLFLIVNMPALPSGSPVFSEAPDLRGATEETFIEEAQGQEKCPLCTSHPLVLMAYEEVWIRLTADLPEVAGFIMLVGGEGFRHCFMRPRASGEATNCPRCVGSDSHEHVARLVNTAFRGIQRGAPGKRLLAWPYSAFVWSHDDPTESRWILDLDYGVEVLSTFDAGDFDATTESRVRLFDYNIKATGPSTRFAAQAEVCKQRGIPFLARSETNTTPDTFFLPCLPVYFRWFERFRAIRESGASGLMGQWRFFGASGSLAEELLYHVIWNPERSAEELLATAAKRDFRLDSESIDRLLVAWREMSDAWDDFPYSAMTCGEREAYMRGPWYLGPAHPLIFNTQSAYSLGDKFFRLRGDLAEMLESRILGALPGKPRYVSDLLICLPFGVVRFLALARSCRDRWDAALRVLEETLGKSELPRARHELHLAETISIHLHSLVNSVEFLDRRDRIGRESSDEEQFEAKVAAISEVIEREIANASRALPILEKNPTIGFGHVYGEVYDRDMVAQKIEQSRFVKDRELPRVASVIRFHTWLRYP